MMDKQFSLLDKKRIRLESEVKKMNDQIANVKDKLEQKEAELAKINAELLSFLLVEKNLTFSDLKDMLTNSTFGEDEKETVTSISTDFSNTFRSQIMDKDSD